MMKLAIAYSHFSGANRQYGDKMEHFVYTEKNKLAPVQSIHMTLYPTKKVDLYITLLDNEAYQAVKKELGNTIKYVDERKSDITEGYPIRIVTNNHLLLNFVLNKLIEISPGLRLLPCQDWAKFIGMDLRASYKSLEEIPENAQAVMTKQTGQLWVESRSPHMTFTNLNPLALISEIKLKYYPLVDVLRMGFQFTSDIAENELRQQMYKANIPLFINDPSSKIRVMHLKGFVALIRRTDPTMDNSSFRRIVEVLDSWRFSDEYTPNSIGLPVTKPSVRNGSEDSLIVNIPRYYSYTHPAYSGAVIVNKEDIQESNNNLNYKAF
jgi:hypothetical protein